MLDKYLHGSHVRVQFHSFLSQYRNIFGSHLCVEFEILLCKSCMLFVVNFVEIAGLPCRNSCLPVIVEKCKQ